MVGELFEHMPVTIGIASGENITVNRFFAKAEMKGFPAMRGSDICEFTETSTSEQLTEYKDKQLSPIRQLPSEGSVLNLVLVRCSMIISNLRFGKKSGQRRSSVAGLTED